MDNYILSIHWMIPDRRRRVKDIVTDLNIPEYRQYLGEFYKEPQMFSNKSVLRMMHEWRVAIYLEGSRSMSKKDYIISIRWLNDYYQDNDDF